MIVKWNHRVEDKLLYRGVRLFAYRASSLSRAAVRMADISLTEALGVLFYCYRCSLLPSDSALEVCSSLGHCKTRNAEYGITEYGIKVGV